MLKNLTVLFALWVSTLTVQGVNGPWLKVVSEETCEQLPFSIIELDNGLFFTTDDNGIADLSPLNPMPDYISVKSFNHEKKTLQTSTLLPSDTLTVKLSPTFVLLKEVEAKPLNKVKDIYIGKKSSLSNEFASHCLIPKPANMPPKDKNDKWSYFGVRINASKNTRNVLKAFGINVQLSPNTPKYFVFKIMIYDVSEDKPKNPRDLPAQACEPIYVLMNRDSITDQGFRYELPEPLDLPDKAVLIVRDGEVLNSMEEGQSIDFVTTFSGSGFLYGNPYYPTSHTIFRIKTTFSPFFWEYTQYSLPKE